MELYPITDIERWYIEELSEAFPKNELKSLEDIVTLMDEGCYELAGLYDGGALIAYAGLWLKPDDVSFILLDYLGVTATKRNVGFGGEMLRRLVEKYRGRSLILAEAEAPVAGDSEEENSIRRRRMGFYLRNGFASVYEMATCGMRFVTFIGGEVPKDLAPVMALHKAIYGADRADVVVPIGKHETPPPSPFGM